MSNIKSIITKGEAILGIEIGSTRIKAILVDDKNIPIASGSYDWESRLENGIWTYSLEEVWKGIQECYRKMAEAIQQEYNVKLETLKAIGFSAMMHGYLAFDQKGKLLVPFRTWRNTITQEASEILTRAFQFQVPQRWSIAHLYQAILNGEDHIPDVDFITALDGYVHWQLTGQRVLGVGSASGMFPIDPAAKTYYSSMLDKFNELAAAHGVNWKIERLLPRVLLAGEPAGLLTPEGARLLDPSGVLQPGCPLCPPEGDAGTGMVATNSVSQRTGNVSAGTSIFAMLVLEKELKKVHEEIDIVTTPSGEPVAMVQCNNCTSDLNAWVHIFREFAETIDLKINMDQLFGVLYNKALEGDKDCGGLLAYNYFAGEHITGFEAGRPLFVRMPDSRFNLANFMRTHLYTALGALKVGLDILTKEEEVTIDRITGHGGLFKTKGVAQKILAGAMNTPVSVMKTAGEGGAWGIALLASYMVHRQKGETLENYLQTHVFLEEEGEKINPDPEDVKGFDLFIKRYQAGLPIERAAIHSLIS